jgi:Cu(I)/Ag(I) efflux system membrane fusion protein
MKSKAIVLFIAILFCQCGCARQPKTDDQIPEADTTQTRNEYTCPMHPEIITNQPGTCPQCSMELQIKS